MTVRRAATASARSRAIGMQGPLIMKETSSAIERPPAMHVVEGLGLALGQAHQAGCADDEALLLEVRDDESGLAAGNGVGLDDGEGAVRSHVSSAVSR